MTALIHYTTPQLLPLIAEGNADAFGQLYKRYYSKLYSVALVYLKLHEVAQDTVQQVFLQLWEKRQKFAGIDDPDNYLFIVARNIILNSLRRESLEEKYQAFVRELFLQETNTPEEALILKQKGHVIERIINTLPAREQEAFRLSRQQGMQYDEIAEKMGVSVAVVKKLMHQAIGRVRTLLIDHKDEFMILFLAFFSKKG